MTSGRTSTIVTLIAFLGLGGCAGDDGAVRPPDSAPASFLRVRADGTGDRPTLQEVLDLAEPGDTVAVAEGTYFECLVVEKPVFLLGGWDTEFLSADSSRETILDGRSAGTVVTITDVPDTTVVLSGFVITHGGPVKTEGIPPAFVPAAGEPAGSGIFCSDASPVISGNTIRDNSAAYGAGILCLRGSPRIRSNAIEDNRALKDGGGILCLEFSGEVSRNTIRGNEAGDEGGGLHVSESVGARFFGNIIEENRADDGGGITCRLSGVVFESTFVKGNYGARSGGGVSVDREGAVLFDACVIGGNGTDGNGAGAYSARGAAPVFISCEFADNAATGSGGALYAASGVTLVQCALSGNGAGMGGGILLGTGSSAELRRCLFLGNSGRTGGAVAMLDNARATFYRNTFFANGADVAGGGFYLVNGEIRLEKNLVIGSTGGGGLYCWSGVSVDLVMNDLWNNAGGDFVGACTLPPPPDLNGNFSEDPLFCDPEGGDFGLQSGSPAVPGEADTLGAFPCGCGPRRTTHAPQPGLCTKPGTEDMHNPGRAMEQSINRAIEPGKGHR